MKQRKPDDRPTPDVISMADWKRRTRKPGPPDRRRPGLRTWHAWAVLILIAALLAFYKHLTAPGPAEIGAVANGGTFACTVASVSDGDTLRCADGTRVRLSAIAARESDGSCRPGHPCPSATAAAAKAALERLALGQTLSCEANGSSYDRVTAWCRNAAGTQLNCAMVEGGYAARWKRFDPEGQLCS